MTTRTAQCHCGKLSVTCEGEPDFVAMCHCQACQRRTGSTYNLGAWYQNQHATIAGDSHQFQRRGDEDILLTYYFCPGCGSSVYWTASAMPDAMGVAVGCFADPDFPKPSVSLYEKHRHHWVPSPEETPCYLGSVNTERLS